MKELIRKSLQFVSNPLRYEKGITPSQLGAVAVGRVFEGTALETEQAEMLTPEQKRVVNTIVRPKFVYCSCRHQANGLCEHALALCEYLIGAYPETADEVMREEDAKNAAKLAAKAEKEAKAMMQDQKKAELIASLRNQIAAQLPEAPKPKGRKNGKAQTSEEPAE